MIEFKGLNYNKEYRELVEAFIPNEDKGLIIIEKNNEDLILKIDDYKDVVKLEKEISKEKTRIKRGIYKLLRKYKETDLVWGILVGVNPLKLFRKLIDINGEKSAREILKNIYLIDDKKIDLGFRIIENQKPLAEEIKGKTSFYIDIPFCPTRCFYCSYSTYNSDNSKLKEYIDTLIYEIKSFKEKTDIKPDTIYIGGGTPSAIPVKELERVVSILKEFYPDITEFTVEIGRPDTINIELLKMLKFYGVDRISINPQTMNDKTLEKIGRNHSSEDIIKAFKMARKEGFNNINMDLIIGLPGENSQDFKYSLEEVINLNPESISIHSLSIKKGSKLFAEDYKNSRDNKFEEVRDTIMKKSEFIPYYMYRQKHIFLNIENIGYSKYKNISKYNIGMMEDFQNIIGFGLGASTKIFENKKINRYMNYRLLDDYIKFIDKNIEDKLKLMEEIKLEN